MIATASELSEREPTSPIVVVCRANLCRSPIAAQLLQARFDERDAGLTVTSAGLDADRSDPGSAMVDSVRDWGVDLSDHRSRPLLVDDVRGSSAVLTMEHHQIAEVLALDPDAWPRTFTFKEIVRRGEDVGARARDESFSSWVARLHRGRLRIAVVGAWGDDVADPAGGTELDLSRTFTELEALADRFVALAWPEQRRWGRRARRGR